MILAHRGAWKDIKEQNSFISFQNAQKLKVGIETDIRDYNGEIIISHDLPTKKTIELKDLFKLWNENAFKSFLALNIKADGLSEELSKYILNYNIDNYFFFDMSIPETKRYKELGLNYFIRISEFEKDQTFFHNSSGVWLDCFISDWYDKELIQSFLIQGKVVAIVSPELHKRPHIDLWKKLKKMNLPWNLGKILICTDFPKEAKEFFYEK